MSAKIDLARAYSSDGDQQKLDQLEIQIQVCKTDVQALEAQLADLRDREAAAKEILTVTERVLASVLAGELNAFGARGSALSDKAKAEKVLKHCTEQIPRAEQGLHAAQSRLVTLEEQRANFDMTGLKAKRALNEVLRRCRLPGH